MSNLISLVAWRCSIRSSTKRHGAFLLWWPNATRNARWRGLAPAQSYASIAPWVPHALHTPSHIFTRLGMWDESIAANRASAEASRAYAAMRHRDATEAEELHALDYMAYSYLQEARDAEAKEIVDLAAKVRKTNPELEFSGAYALAAIPTRYVFERNDWAAAATLPIPNVPHWSSFPFMEALIEYGHALGRVHTGDLDGARKAIARMQLGGLLLEMGQPKDAEQELEAALKIYPGRFRGLYEAAQAAEQSGDDESASRYYTRLAVQTSKARGSRHELNHVREFLSAQAKPADSKGVASAPE